MSANKKFDKIVKNENYIDENTPEPVSEQKKPRFYKFRRASLKKDFKKYEVGFIPVYVMFACSFIPALVYAVLRSQGAFGNFSEGASYVLSVLSDVLIFIIPAVIFRIVYKPVSERSAYFYARPFSASFVPFIIISLFLLIFFVASGKFAVSYFFSPIRDESLAFVSVKNVLVYILVQAVVPAVCEEILFRGVFQPEIAEKAGGFTAIVVSSLAFALIHLDLAYFPVYFISSLILSAVAHVTSSCLPSVIIHAAYNVFSVYFSPRLTFIESERIGISFILIIFTITALIFLLLWLRQIEKLCRRKSIEITLQNAPEGAPENENAKHRGGKIRFYSPPFRLFSDTGYSFHKLLRYVFSPVMILAVTAFFLINLL